MYYRNFGKKNELHRSEIIVKIIEIYRLSNGIYGAPKITKELNKNGIFCSQSTVSRYMKIIGIKSIVLRTYKNKINKLSNKEKPFIINLIKNVVATEINQVWTTDITYIKTINDNNLFLITFIDSYSKKVVTWDLAYNQTSETIIKVLKWAITIRKPNPGLIVHSDKGSQFRSHAYKTFISKHNIVQSFTSLNHNCDENPAQESFHASLKKEKIYHTKIYNYQEAYNAIYEYIEGFYNPIRTHSALGYLSPIEFEKLHNS